jgi:hypothetical protein
MPKHQARFDERPSKPFRVTIVIDNAALHRVRDIAHKIWSETKHPNSNLVLLEALATYINQNGGTAGFRVEGVSETKDGK